MQHRIFLVNEINIFCGDCTALSGSKCVEELSQDKFKYCTQLCLKCHKTLVSAKTGAFNVFDGQRPRKEAERLIQQIRDHEEMHEFFQQYWKQPYTLVNHVPSAEAPFFQKILETSKSDLIRKAAERDGLDVTYLDIIEPGPVNPFPNPIPGHNED